MTDPVMYAAMEKLQAEVIELREIIACVEHLARGWRKGGWDKPAEMLLTTLAVPMTGRSVVTIVADSRDAADAALKVSNEQAAALLLQVSRAEAERDEARERVVTLNCEAADERVWHETQATDLLARSEEAEAQLCEVRACMAEGLAAARRGHEELQRRAEAAEARYRACDVEFTRYRNEREPAHRRAAEAAERRAEEARKALDDIAEHDPDTREPCWCGMPDLERGETHTPACLDARALVSGTSGTDAGADAGGGDALYAEGESSVLRARVETLQAAMHAAALVRCPACPGNEWQGHDDRCWYGVILRGVPGPEYDGAAAALVSDTTTKETP